MGQEPLEIRARYDRRGKVRPALQPCLPMYNAMVISELRMALVRWIKWADMVPVCEKRLLEIGCGTGTNLLEFLLLGFQPENLVANELLEERVRRARHVLPTATEVIAGDAAELDFGNQTFDVVFQSTVFTSILDDSFQERLAARMWAWVRPRGGVLWYDYIYNNPWNSDVRGVPIKRIRELFPQGQLKVWRVTLAPPIGRLVTKISSRLYATFNAVPLLRTHVLCWIHKK
jgi:SAM-dependent methyltransferase